MRHRTIVALDRVIGIPACLLLNLCAFFRRLLRRGETPPVKDILFIKLAEMGSLVLACPAIEHAASCVGREHLMILVSRQNRAILDVLPWFEPENIFEVSTDSFFGLAASLRRQLAAIRKRRPDTAIDLEGLARGSAIVTYLTGALRRVGCAAPSGRRTCRSRLYTEHADPTRHRHVTALYLALVCTATRKFPSGPVTLPVFEPGDDDRRNANDLLRRHSVSAGARLVVFSPNCNDPLPLRTWPAERYVELGRQMLRAFPGTTILLTGVTSEALRLQNMAHEIDPDGRAVALGGQTGMRELLTLYCRSALVVASDSGPCHFASLTRTPAVCLFGPETHEAYGPLDPGARVVSAALPCSPCFSMANNRCSRCRDNRCMQGISVVHVMEEVEKVLRGEPHQAAQM